MEALQLSLVTLGATIVVVGMLVEVLIGAAAQVVAALWHLLARLALDDTFRTMILG